MIVIQVINNKYMKFRKVLLLATATLVSVITATAQNINGGFEQWDSVNNGVFTNHLPRGWAEFTNFVCETEDLPWAVTRSNDARTGLSALQLKNVATSLNQTTMIMSNSANGAGFDNKIPVNARYTRLEGYYKYTTAEPDTFTIMVLMMNAGDFIAVANYEQPTNTSTYTKFSIPIIYSAPSAIVPDSAIIMISAGSTNTFREGSTLLVDDVAFALTNGVNDYKDELRADVSVYPNPASEFINVSVKGAAHGNVTVELVNVIGQTLQKEEVKPVNQQVDLSLKLNDAPKGILFVKVSDSSGSKGYRVINQ